MVELISGEISIDKTLKQMQDHATGAVVFFLGRVRDQAAGRQVTKMEYQSYAEMALKKMEEIEKEAKRRWPVKKIMMVHRTGQLQLGEISVAIAVASCHRSEAFAACRFAIDTLKKTVPIWKKEYFVNGESWVEGVVPKVVDAG